MLIDFHKCRCEFYPTGGHPNVSPSFSTPASTVTADVQTYDLGATLTKHFKMTYGNRHWKSMQPVTRKNVCRT